MAASPTIAYGLPCSEMTRSTISGERLDSWKSIALFCGRTVRTVQRWEMTEGLPIRRHIHETIGSVYAFASEISAWQVDRSLRIRDVTPSNRRHRLRLAVLPFANLSKQSRLRGFEDGLAHEIVAQLSVISPAHLGVIACRSVMSCKDGTLDITQIGHHWNVDYVLEGSIRMGAGQIRLATQLVAVADQTQVWAECYLRRWSDCVSLQIRFARRISTVVGRHLLT